jgi:hypothetical protein
MAFGDPKVGVVVHIMQLFTSEIDSMQDYGCLRAKCLHPVPHSSSFYCYHCMPFLARLGAST